MKKILLLALLLNTAFGFSQTSSFSDDFESYSAGDLIAENSMDWRTWENLSGIDAPISSDQAFSGENSLHIFAESATGPGPMDIFLPFEKAFDQGTFHFEMMMFIESGAYFNFQGSTTEGQTWTFQPEFSADGTVAINNSDNAAVETVDYPMNEWFKISVDVELTLNEWVISINDTEVANFANVENKTGGLNLYPLAGHSYYIDDISYTHDRFLPANFDLAVLAGSLPPKMLAGKTYPVTGVVKNLGLTAVTSYDITLSDGTNEITKSVSDITLNFFQENVVEFDDPFFADPNGASGLTFSISNINGETADDNVDNNDKDANISIVVPAPDKAVYVEEGTGTWCGWCPRGAVGMEYMAHEYPNLFVGVAVHNGSTDPMVVADHDLGVRTFPGFGGFPGGVVERAVTSDPAAGALESAFFDYITQPTVASLENHVEYDDATRTVTVEVSATFKEDVSGDYRLSAIVREDNVTGTSNAYRQSNFYAGGGNGPMGGYENLPNPVPAADMVYNEVSRALLGGFAGQSGSLPSSIAAGETHSYTFSYVVPSGQHPENMGIAALLLRPDGTAENAKLTKYPDWATQSSVVNVQNHNAFKSISPNPVADMTFIHLDLESGKNVSVQIFNNMGQMVLNRNYGQLTGGQVLPLNASTLANGVYHAKINIDNEFVTRSIVVSK